MKLKKQLKRNTLYTVNKVLLKTAGIQIQNARGRNTPINESDKMIVSYPKSGNTWVCFLVSNLLYPDKTINFSNVLQVIPNIYDLPLEVLRERSGRLLKSHEYFDPRYKRVIYVVRDPRSVAVSYYHFLVRRKEISLESEFSNFLVNFLEGRYNAYGSWQENVGSWLGAIENDNEKFLIIKYEDLLETPVENLRFIADFLSIRYNQQSLTNAVSSSSFDNMKQIEQNEQDSHVNFKDKDHSIPFVRRGESEEWKRFFTNKDLDNLYNYCGKQMEMLNYE